MIAIDEADQELVEDEEDDDERPTVARRQVYPPLRRWAAGRLVGREPQRWGVRRQGIGLVAERKGPEAAHAIAAGDPSAGVRAWAPSLLDPPQPKEPPAPATLF